MTTDAKGNENILTGYRFFVRDGGRLTSTYGNVKWPEPNGAAGEWVTHEGPLANGARVTCGAGFHWSPTIYGALLNRRGAEFFKVEAAGEHDSYGDVTCSRKLRLMTPYSRRQVVGLSVLCAQSVLHLFKSRVSGDRRPRKAIMAAIRWVTDPSAAAAAAAAAWCQQFETDASALLAVPEVDLGAWLNARMPSMKEDR